MFEVGSMLKGFSESNRGAVGRETASQSIPFWKAKVERQKAKVGAR